MPYKVYKKGSGYKACKKDGKKCYSKKPLSKEKAQSQMKALYASESVVNEEKVKPNTLEYVKLWRYSKANQFHVWFKLQDMEHVLVSLVFTSGKTMNDVDYIETQITDGSAPNIQIFEDPQSEEAQQILSHYGLTGDDIENAGQESYEKIGRYVPDSKPANESLQFEKFALSILQGEQKS